MNVASLELCKELYELSGWNDPDGGLWGPDEIEGYTLDYLFNKLPAMIVDKQGYPSWIKIAAYTDTKFQAAYGIKKYRQFADSPKHAACKLAIELFKQGVLKRESEKTK